MAGKRNRSAGHNFERCIVNELKQIGFPEAVTARSESRNLDNKGVDIANVKFYNIQCKSALLTPNYHELITNMPQDPEVINLVIHRKTKKAKTRFVTQDDYVMLRKSDFFKILKKLHLVV